MAAIFRWPSHTKQRSCSPPCPQMTTTAALLNSRYYDIDDFLADEELLPCTTMYDFTLLAHLKADEGGSTTTVTAGSASSSNKNSGEKDRHLDGNTKLQMPIWTIREWSRLNYVKIKVPKKYSSTARDSVKADPLHFELNQSYFRSGKALVQMLLNSAGGQSGGPAAVEAAELQQTLLLVRFFSSIHYYFLLFRIEFC
jgi:hypothetical protein